MKKRTQTFRLLAVFVLLAAAAFLAVPGAVLAAAGKTTKTPVELEDGKTYSIYDITGNGKRDKIRVRYVPRNKSAIEEAYANVFVNGKKKNTIRMMRGGLIYLIAPTSKTVYLIADSYGYGFNSEYLYKWKSGKFRSAYKNSLGENKLDHVRPYKVSKSGFSMLLTVGQHQNFVNIEVHTPVFIVNYKIQNGKVSLKSRYANMLDTGIPATVQYAGKLSTSPTVNDEKGPSLVGGGTVMILQMYINKGADPSFQVKTESGQTGWITYDMYADNELPLLH